MSSKKNIISKQKFFHRFLCCTFLAIFILLSSGLPGLAQKEPIFPLDDPQSEQLESIPEVPPSPNAPGLNSTQELEGFSDQFFNSEMPKSHIPGAVVSVVKDGKLFFAKGYGYADIEKKIPVDADRTLFRVASLSKLFTATAAMQIYERGLLDLNADINQYLTTFKLNNPFPEPARVAQLMTHTDGTTQRLIGIAAPTAAKMEPLGDYLADHMPPIVWQPGKLYSYSNHSIALLGYLVERLSGLPFIDYMDKNIFQPLEMRRSTFLQPPPPALAQDLAVGYQYRSGQFQPVPFLYLNIAPAAALSATATDMAHFMIAHLLKGRYENSRILQEDTARLMHQQHFTQHPKLPGTAYGFRERLENNLRMIEHLGSLRGYSSLLTLIPDRNVGVFIATNSFQGIHEKFLSQFLDRYFPIANEPTPSKPYAMSDQNLDRFTGTYRDLEYPRHTLAKISAPFKLISIKKGSNQTLMIRRSNLFFMSNASDLQLAPVAPMLFQRVNDDAMTAFGTNEVGKIAFAFEPLWAKIGTYERVSWYERVWFQLGVIGGCAVIFLSALVYLIVARIQGRRKRESHSDRSSKRAWQLAGLTSALNLIFLVGLPLSLWLYGIWKLVYGVPPVVVALLCIPLLTSILSIGLVIFTGLAWKNKRGSIIKRLHYSLITLAAIIFIPILGYWNLLGFQF
ncbi:serine hydrolase domain-containing protein [Leptolyngbya sp. AN03gr2]|uniref:serine hydrolase domain-containing protein n=1 Tax=unclassified Leptolyngbya TaxID=2650499 RepID=UPI003D31E228